MSVQGGSMNARTRRSVVVGVGAAALGAGALLAWKLSRPQIDTAPLWDASFETPQGGKLQMAALRGHPLIVNFWATWCAPCIKELPELDRYARAHAAAGWRVVGIALDRAEAVRAFLQARPVSFAIGIAGMEGFTLIRALGNEGGLLPYSLALDRKGRLLRRKLGATDYAELLEWGQAAQ